MHQYRKLIVWKMAVDLAVKTYEMTKKFPNEEKYGLIQQLKRSSVSIPSNIAEGAGRLTNNEFRYFLGVAYGSSCELDTQWVISHKTGLLDDKEYSELLTAINELQKRLYQFQKSCGSD